MNLKELSNKYLTKKTVQIKLLIVTGLLLIYFIVDIIVMPLYTRQGRERPIPNLIGLSITRAAQIADSAQFEVIAEPAKLSNKVPAGMVAEQMPRPGALAKGGRKIHITPALAPAGDVAPDLVGLDLRDAQIRCKNVGLVSGATEVSYRFSATVAKNSVIAQKPKAYSTVKPGGEVYITVSLGPEPTRFLVPALVEKTLHDARTLLQEAGLQTGKISRKETDQFAANTVIAQSVRTGQEVERGTEIDLVVAVPLAGEKNKTQSAD